jgi:hypothetical protein
MAGVGPHQPGTVPAARARRHAPLLVLALTGR